MRRRYLIFIATAISISCCGIIYRSLSYAESRHADFAGASIDNGFSSSLDGSGTANTSSGKLLLRSPAGGDAAIVRMDNSIVRSAEWTVTTRASSTVGIGGTNVSAVNQRATSMAVRSSAGEPLDDRMYFALDPSTNKYMINYRGPTTANNFWTGAAWTTTGTWVSGVTSGTEYIFITESKQNDNVWQLRWTILLASDNSTITQTTWTAWDNVYNDGSGNPLWLWAGERYTDVLTNSADIEYIYYDEPAATSVPGAAQNLTLTPDVNSMLIEWDAPITGDLPTGYYVYRSTDSGSNWSAAIATLDNATFSFTDEWEASASYAPTLFGSLTSRLGLRHATRYDYKVVAYNATGNSPDATANDNTTSPTPASGSNRGKHLVGLIIQSTDSHGGGNAVDPSLAQTITAHDWIRANVTTKITLFLSMEILTATSGGALDVLNYVDNLVNTYNYDIVTIPHPAWLPLTSPYSLGISNEQARMQSAHDNVFAKWGKYPIFSMAWSYNSDLIEKAIALGYRVAPSGINDQYAIDGYTSLGSHPGLYRPSKRNVLMAGDGTPANTYDIVAGFQMVQRSPSFPEIAAAGGSQYAGMYSIGVCDIPADFVQAKQGIIDIANSTNQNARPWYVMDYWDPAWMFNSDHGGEFIGDDRENLFSVKNVALWEKAYLHPGTNPIADYVTATEFATWADSAIRSPTDAQFVLGTHKVIGETGVVPPVPGDQMAWYGSRAFTSKIRWRTGSGGHVRMVDYIPYSSTDDEPNPPADDWSNTSGVLRSSGTPPLTVKLHLGSDNVTISGATAGDNVANVHAPTYSILGNNSIVAWDIYNTANTERLTHFYVKLREGGLCWGHNADYSGLTVSATGLLSNHVCGKETLKRYVPTR